MYFDDFIARQTMNKTDVPAPRVADTRRSDGHLLRPLWRGVRRALWGIDAFSRVQHGIDVPPDHGARTGPRHP